MTVFQRAATAAAMMLGITGMIGASTPGFAREMDRTKIITSALPIPFPMPIPVPAKPAPAPVVDTDATVPLVPVDDAVPVAVEYASLAAAVAAQDMPDDMDRDLECMAGAIYFEAKGEPLSGQLAVAEVILNRAKSTRFPSSICSVITQRGQFSFVRHGRIPAIRSGPAYRKAIAVAKVAMADMWDSPAEDALYFHAKRVSPGWRKKQIASIGHHLFYR